MGALRSSAVTDERGALLLSAVRLAESDDHPSLQGAVELVVSVDFTGVMRYYIMVLERLDSTAERQAAGIRQLK